MSLYGRKVALTATFFGRFHQSHGPTPTSAVLLLGLKSWADFYEAQARVERTLPTYPVSSSLDFQLSCSLCEVLIGSGHKFLGPPA